MSSWQSVTVRSRTGEGLLNTAIKIEEAHPRAGVSHFHFFCKFRLQIFCSLAPSEDFIEWASRARSYSREIPARHKVRDDGRMDARRGAHGGERKENNSGRKALGRKVASPFWMGERAHASLCISDFEPAILSTREDPRGFVSASLHLLHAHPSSPFLFVALTVSRDVNTRPFYLYHPFQQAWSPSKSLFLSVISYLYLSVRWKFTGNARYSLINSLSSFFKVWQNYSCFPIWKVCQIIERYRYS